MTVFTFILIVSPTGYNLLLVSHESDVWFAFEPTQIKSTFNRGTWSPTEPAMLAETVDTTADELSRRNVPAEFLKMSGEQILQLMKEMKINIQDKDITNLSRWLKIPFGQGMKEPDYKMLQDIIDTRLRNFHVIRNGYLQDLAPTWAALTGEENKQVGDLLWRGDELRAPLSETELQNLPPKVAKAYTETRNALDFIWLEHMRELCRNLGIDEEDINERLKVGYRPAYMPHPREGKWALRALVPVKQIIRAKAGNPFRTAAQAIQALA